MEIKERIAKVLAAHQKESTGMTYGTPDRCYCGQEVYTPKGDADVMDRKIEAFAAHQAGVLVPLIAEVWDEAEGSVGLESNMYGGYLTYGKNPFRP